MHITRTQNKLITDWYSKPTASGRYIHFLSHHPLSQKQAIIYDLIDKCLQLSHAQFHNNNIKKVKSLLLDNGYPMDFIDKHIKKRLSKIRNQNNEGQLVTTDNVFSKSLKFILPFNEFLAPYFNSLFHRYKIIPIYKNANKLNGIIRLGKDPVNKLDKTNVIYNINCENCPSTYIGQTKRCLSERINEHKKYIIKNDNKSVLAFHSSTKTHNFDFDKVKILDTEKFLHKRLFLEMLNIEFYPNTLNIMQDTQFLKHSYKKNVNFLSSFLK